MNSISYGTFTPEFVSELAAWVGDRRVLEIFAGNGLLASKLSNLGINIVSTSLFQGHDGHEHGMNFDVKERDCIDAVVEFGDSADILLMSWPTTTDAAAGAAMLWGDDRPIIFIGEVTNLELNHYGGCATDLFFDLTNETEQFSTYRSERGVLDRAAIRHTKTNARELWKASREEVNLRYDVFGWTRK